MVVIHNLESEVAKQLKHTRITRQQEEHIAAFCFFIYLLEVFEVGINLIIKLNYFWGGCYYWGATPQF